MRLWKEFSLAALMLCLWCPRSFFWPKILDSRAICLLLKSRKWKRERWPGDHSPSPPLLIHTHVCVYIYIYICIYVCMHGHTHTYMYANAHGHTNLHLCVYIYVLISACFWPCFAFKRYFSGSLLSEPCVMLLNCYRCSMYDLSSPFLFWATDP